MVQVDRSKIVETKNLDEALSLFGIHRDEKIDIRTLMIARDIIIRELKACRQDFERAREHDRAAEIRNRLLTIADEFAEIQLEQKGNEMSQEVRRFNEASRTLKDRSRSRQQTRRDEIENLCNERRDHLAKVHQIQRDNLEEEIATMHKPEVRYSKALLNQMHMEEHLSRLGQYEEAKILNKRIAAAEPTEANNHHKKFDQKCQAMRDKLATRQAFEVEKLEAKLKTLSLTTEEKLARESSLEKNRLEISKSMMDHSHKVEGSTPDAYCAVRDGKVRSVVPRRKSYEKTSAMYRGTQMLENVNRGAKGNSMPLSKIHDFDNTPAYTHEY